MSKIQFKQQSGITVMTQHFNWLHLSDLHFGMPNQRSLWPGARSRFFEDLSRLHDLAGPWQIVIFSGDLTYSGQEQEFEELNGFIEELWNYFALMKFCPSLVAVPGNHDLVWPDKNNAKLRPMLRELSKWEKEVQDDFWNLDDCPHRKLIRDAFSNYLHWWKNQPHKIQSIISGLLPGDFSTNIQENNIKIGIVGLNTAFLQLDRNDYMKRLALYHDQFHKACGGDGVTWARQCDACLLITHHPPSWLNEASYQYLRQEITDRGRFAVHLCGHLHDPFLQVMQIGGSEPIRLWQCRSLFGLDYFLGQRREEMRRSHGYTIGRIEITNRNGQLLFWPRVEQIQGEERKIVPDYLVNLTEDQCTNPIPFPITTSALSSQLPNNASFPGPIPLQTGVNEYVKDIDINEYVKDIDTAEIVLLRVPGKDDLYSSFQCDLTNDRKSQFIRLKIDTTPGWIYDNETKALRQNNNNIFIIRDPIRPFETQIGELRALRPGSDPGRIELMESFTLNELSSLYNLIFQGNDSQWKWLRMVLAEIAHKEDLVNFIYTHDQDTDVKKTATRNPTAPVTLQELECPFCQQSFREKRSIYENEYAYIIHNDFPFGPFFHYLLITNKPFHYWGDLKLKDLRESNVLLWDFLVKKKQEDRLNDSRGVEIGLNSSIRHLVIGKRTHSSAGASIPHVHKQIWGMIPGSVNIGDYLSRICDTYTYRINSVDYLDCYLKALDQSGLTVWQDENVVLYVPFCQISVHEMQAMIRRKTGDFTELTEDEVRSLSTAEFIVAKLYDKMGITSFNEITISKPFNSEVGKDFRLIVTFITREVELAVSELNLLYVVDKHPWDTRKEINGFLPDICRKLESNEGS